MTTYPQQRALTALVSAARARVESVASERQSLCTLLPVIGWLGEAEDLLARLTLVFEEADRLLVEQQAAKRLEGLHTKAERVGLVTLAAATVWTRLEHVEQAREEVAVEIARELLAEACEAEGAP